MMSGCSGERLRGTKKGRTSFSIDLRHDVGLVETRDLGGKVEQGTAGEYEDPLALAGQESLYQPEHRDEESTDKESFEQDVHL
jgi:hypothetical protein